MKTPKLPLDPNTLLDNPENFSAAGRQQIIHAALRADDRDTYNRFVSAGLQIQTRAGSAYWDQINPLTLAREDHVYAELSQLAKVVGWEQMPITLYYRENNLNDPDALRKAIELADQLGHTMSSTADLSSFYEKCTETARQWNKPNLENKLYLPGFPDPEVALKRLAYIARSHRVIHVHGSIPGVPAGEFKEVLRNHPLLVCQYAQKRKSRYGAQSDLFHGFVLAGVDAQGNQRQIAVEVYLGVTRKYTDKSLAQHWRQIAQMKDSGEHIHFVDILSQVKDIDMLARAPEGWEEWSHESLSYLLPEECLHDDEQLMSEENRRDLLKGASFKVKYCRQCGEVLEHINLYKHLENKFDELRQVMERYNAISVPELSEE